MSSPRDKLGSFILHAESAGPYEPFALKTENGCVLDEEHPDEAYPAEIRLRALPGLPRERRALVHSDYVYGSRRTVEQVAFNLLQESSSWTMSGSTGGSAPVPPAPYEWRFGVAARPVLTEFDPTDTSWNDAHGEGSEMSFGSEGSFEILRLDATLGCTPQNFPGPMNQPPVAGADVSLSGTWPGELVAKFDDVSAWNEEEAIYGFELRLTTFAAGASPSAAEWTGTLAAPQFVCYVIRG